MLKLHIRAGLVMCVYHKMCGLYVASLYPGADILITIGIIMAIFPLFYAVLENDLKSGIFATVKLTKLDSW